MEQKDLIAVLRKNSQKLNPQWMSEFEKCIYQNLEERETFRIDYIKSEKYVQPTADAFLNANHHFKHLIQNHTAQLEAFVKELIHFSHDHGWHRVAQRSSSLSFHYQYILKWIASFYIFEKSEMSLKGLIYGDYRELNFDFSPVIAGYLLINNEEAIQYVVDVLTSENNTAALTRPVIVAIEMSQNEVLQDLLLKVLLAARLQEGLRQAIMETCDSYQLAFFRKTLEVVKANQLMRYSSIQRAVCTWCQLGRDTVDEKYATMLLDKIWECFNQPIVLSKDDHPLDLYIKLCVMAMMDSDQATDEAFNLLDAKNRSSLSAVLLFLKLSNHFYSEDHIEIFDAYQDDPWVMAMYFSCISSEPVIDASTANGLLTRFSEYLKTFKDIKNVHTKGFDYISLSMDKTSIAFKMMAILKAHPTQENVLLCLPYFKYVTYMSFYRENKDKLFQLVPKKQLKQYCISQLADTNMQETCAKLLKEMKLSDSDLVQIEDKLKSKRANTRKLVSEILTLQPKELVIKSYERLSQDKNVYKVEVSHELERNHGEWFSHQQEKLFYTFEEGFGFFKPVPLLTKPLKNDLVSKKSLFKKEKIQLNYVFKKDKAEILKVIKAYQDIFDAHRLDTYVYAEKELPLEDFHYAYNGPAVERLPLHHLWQAQMEKHPLDMDTLFELHILHLQLHSAYSLHDCFIHPSLFVLEKNEVKDLEPILIILDDFYWLRREEAIPHLMEMIMLFLKTCTIDKIPSPYAWQRDKEVPITNHGILIHLLDELETNCDAVFEEAFPILYNYYLRCINLKNIQYRGYRPASILLIKAYRHGYISEDELCTILLTDPKDFAQAYNDAYFEGRHYYRSKPHFEMMPFKHYDKEDIQTLRELLDKAADVFALMESIRINEETPASPYIESIRVLNGAKYLPELMHALGHDHFVRNPWGHDKLSLITKLVRNAYPLKGEDLSVLTSIEEEKLIELAMLAPQWIKPVCQTLKWDGLEEAFYYFIAHMKEYDWDEKKATIAHYTQMDPSDLQDGAFDRTWFIEIYTKLGEKRYQALYQAAKYLCENSYHSRVRKYGDAALNLLDKQDLLKGIKEKRNKDLLNAYTILPLESDKDLQERYLTIQQFVKESKQFGAQRQASEKRAAEIALMNLAMNSSYENTTRLTWAMETSILNESLQFLEEKEVEDYTICIEIDEKGDNAIIIKNKNQKVQKSIPSKIKKNETVLEYSRIHHQWSEQKRRSKRLLEEAMEDRIYFSKAEIETLLDNPIVNKMITKLVFTDGEIFDFVSKQTIATFKDQLRIAHCFDLYRAGNWHEFQKFIFDQKIVQPFKQVFRELYTKLPEENMSSSTNRYSGYQIEVKKVIAALKNRRWSVSYEEGLEKIDYKDNIVVHLYADADWFSPADIEAPSIDDVKLSNRKTGEPVLIQDVSDIAYSEIMRDVDLAVSISSVGGVDPITSVSTIALRKRIVELTANLLKLDNIDFKDNFVHITGSRAKYLVHLQTGMVRQVGGASIHIVPVHSQKRGRLYLPFIDEDPKCQEILSKVVLLSEDAKIKDPEILRQITTDKIN